MKYDSKNILLNEKSRLINSQLSNNIPTIPTTIEEELKMNVFLRCNDVDFKQSLDMKGSSDQEVFTKLRDLKDTF